MTFPTLFPRLYGIPLPTPFQIGAVNCYVAEEDGADGLTLIDCGVKTDEAYAALRSGLAAHGHAIRDIQRLIITHHHADHIGLARRIVDEAGAEVWTHPLTAPWIEKPAESKLALRRFTSVLFRQAGVAQPLIDLMDEVGNHLEELGGGSVLITRLLNEGDLITLAGLAWRVYHTPGHAGGLVCFFEPESRVLLASDHLLRDVSSNSLIEPPDATTTERPKRLLDYMREMRRMTTLAPTIAYTGHGDPITDVCPLVETRLAFHQKRADKLYGALSAEPEPQLLYSLTKYMFPTVPDTQLYLTLSEVIGHLDLLERDGRARSELSAGLRYWYAIAPSSN